MDKFYKIILSFNFENYIDHRPLLNGEIGWKTDGMTFYKIKSVIKDENLKN